MDLEAVQTDRVRLASTRSLPSKEIWVDGFSDFMNGFRNAHVSQHGEKESVQNGQSSGGLWCHPDFGRHANDACWPPEFLVVNRAVVGLASISASLKVG
jgi:hypothetical protein